MEMIYHHGVCEFICVCLLAHIKKKKTNQKQSGGEKKKLRTNLDVAVAIKEEILEL